jgi:acetyl/propionyl-CoA carboxylase alpha subunit
MRTLLVCRGPIAFETLEVYRHQGWQLPYVIVSSKEWIADLYRAAPWIADLPHDHVHYVQEYNDIEAIVHLALEHHLDAVYPGYGFLAENADFAERIEHSGVRFIGPTPETLRAVGDKDSAIALARQLGIPTIPGDDALIAFAHTAPQEAIMAETVQRTLAMASRHPGYPIRLKHPAGGGGKGQRVLVPNALQAPEAPASIRDALNKVWSEMGVAAPEADARKGVLIELNIPRPLHWEVQLFGDGDTVVHFAARDCSLQNHGYQKFIEVALHPQAIAQESARLDPHTDAARIASLHRRQETLERICADALRLGQAVRLRGAATVEFLIDEQGHPYFLEVNPRIQVEHGVTESIVRVCGEPISLVAWQQRVAAGEKLTFQQSDITCVGDAIEVRLNAWHEDLSPVLGGVVHALRLAPVPELNTGVRIDASGLLQRRQPWVVPSYDANFALIIVSGCDRRDTLQRLILTLEQALQVHGNADLQTNLYPLLGLLTLMQALPPETAFRTDTSLLWMALAAIVATRKSAVLSLLPTFPRRLAPPDPALCARLLRATLEAGFNHPSRLLAYYLKRVTQPAPRPLATLEVLWQLAAELQVPLRAEEHQQGEALHEATAALWAMLSASASRLTALVQAAAAHTLEEHPDYHTLVADMLATTSALSHAEAAALLHHALGWFSADVPALTTLIETLERTQLHLFLTVNDDLSLTRPVYLDDEALVTHLHHVLSQSLRPALLRHGELLSPMEATIYHHPEPGAPPFVMVGEEVKVGQTLALLEAMKMFSELPSPVDGVVLDVLVESGQGVKTGTPLFRIATQDTGLETTGDGLHQVFAGTVEEHFGVLRPLTARQAGGRVAPPA